MKRFFAGQSVALVLLVLAVMAMCSALILFLRNTNPAYSKSAAMLGMGLAMFAWVAQKLTHINK